jgi:protoporphyrinogen oxidase
MSAHWLGDRVARPDVAAIRQRVESGHTDERWGPNRTFRFPARGGTGEIWRRLAAGLNSSRVRFEARVLSVNTAARRLRLSRGQTIAYDALISTMPLDSLVAISDMKTLSHHARGLVHNSVHVIGYGLKGSIPGEAEGMCWLYFPEPEDPFYRVTMFSHYSPANAPEGCYSVMAEVAESPAKPVNRREVVASSLTRLRAAGLVGAGDKVVSCWTRRLERAYPVPSLGRDAALDAILPALEERSVYSRGRFGAWKYEVGNMDHSYAQGVEIADRLATGKPEITIARPSYVNEQDGGR